MPPTPGHTEVTRVLRVLSFSPSTPGEGSSGTTLQMEQREARSTGCSVKGSTLKTQTPLFCRGRSSTPPLHHATQQLNQYSEPRRESRIGKCCPLYRPGGVRSDKCSCSSTPKSSTVDIVEVSGPATLACGDDHARASRAETLFCGKGSQVSS